MRTNYPAILVCAIVYWLLGALWYDGSVHQAVDGARRPGGNAGEQYESGLDLSFVITFFLNLLIAFVLAQVCIWRNANTAARGAAMGILFGSESSGRLSTPRTCTKRGRKHSSPSTNFIRWLVCA